MPLIPCSLCGNPNSHEARTCPSCGHVLPARHNSNRIGWMVAAIPFTIIGTLSLILSLSIALGGEQKDSADVFESWAIVLVPWTIAAICWANHFRRTK